MTYCPFFIEEYGGLYLSYYIHNIENSLCQCVCLGSVCLKFQATRAKVAPMCRTFFVLMGNVFWACPLPPMKISAGAHKYRYGITAH